ncbi:MAG: RNA methyltransferase [Propionivibrio sp.]|uniref:RNA methyltransferase n=1 Tax=Propionivibrio sp. TaxID=2212460 RepID=UPI0026015B0B|nr:RNA methyltransferase [Propionivibrio sp.]MBL0206788.1 RNA methyltransferase [Propionivibrio sp.]
MRIESIRQRLRALGAKPCHEDRVLRAWLQARALDSGTRRQKPENFLPLTVRNALPELTNELAALARLRSEHPGSDGSSRLLVELADGLTVECVLLPRDGLCVSTQIGCAVGCVFCMTGRDGLQRQLGSAEMVAQVVLARHRRAVRKVVFMGMGEPAHNLDNVLEAVELLGTSAGIGHKNLVFSTVGDRRVFQAFERLSPAMVKPALAISLHSTNPDLRAQLLPRAPRIDPAKLVELGERYARSTGYPVQYQWTLLEGINDSAIEMEELVKLLAGKHAMMNFIPYNPVDGLDFKRPSHAHALALAGTLHRHGIVACLRDSAGQDIDGACGQLRARNGVLGSAHASASPSCSGHTSGPARVLKPMARSGPNSNA